MLRGRSVESLEGEVGDRSELVYYEGSEKVVADVGEYMEVPMKPDL